MSIAGARPRNCLPFIKALACPSFHFRGCDPILPSRCYCVAYNLVVRWAALVEATRLGLKPNKLVAIGIGC